MEVNVGGVVYTTTAATLARKGGLLAMLFGAETEEDDGGWPQDRARTAWPGPKTLQDRKGRPFIDRDGPAFAAVLAFLRTGVAEVPPTSTADAVQRELCFYFPGPDTPPACPAALAWTGQHPWRDSFWPSLCENAGWVRDALAALPTPAIPPEDGQVKLPHRVHHMQEGLFFVRLEDHDGPFYAWQLIVSCLCSESQCIFAEGMRRLNNSGDDALRVLGHLFRPDTGCYLSVTGIGLWYRCHSAGPSGAGDSK